MLPYLQPLVSVQKCCFGLIHTFVALCLIPLLLQTHLQNFHTGPEDVGGIAGIYAQNFAGK